MRLPTRQIWRDCNPTRGLAMPSFFRPGPGTVSRMAAPDAVDLAARDAIVLIDVREMGEVTASGKARGALHVPLASLKMKCDPSSPECLAELKSGKPLAVYCASGGRSQMAAQMLAGFGYGEVFNIGGLGDWHAAGGAISR